MKNKFSLFLIIPILFLSISSLGFGWYLGFKTEYTKLGSVILVLSFLFILLVITELVLSFKNRIRFIARMSKDISITQRETLYNFPAPAFIIDENHIIVWINSRFDKEVFNEKDAFGTNLDELMDINFDRLFTTKGTLVAYKDKYYRAIATKPDTNQTSLIMIYFKDETEYINLDIEHKQSHTSVMIISVDDYEDILENARESEKAHILVEIEKLVENYIEPTTGITKRLSSNRFYIFLEERHLATMVNERFKILDDARKIKVTDRQNVTLSIGVGRYGKNLQESELFARQAIDMCQGRGGDQAAVKTANGFEFYGGLSKGIEKRTKVKTRIIATAIKEALYPAEKVFIMGHRNADLDSVGSATGLCSLLRKTGQEAYVVVDPELNLSESLINHINTNESETYYIPPEVAINMKTNNTVLVIVDTHNPELLDSKELYEMFDKVIVIDHHRKMVKHIDNALIFFHEPYASSTSEMVTELIQYYGLENVKLSSAIAEALLAGIMLDTKDFVMRTGVRTFEAAAFLKQQGADTVMVKALFSTSLDLYKEKSELISNAIIHNHCAISITDRTDDKIRIAASQAADELLCINDVEASFLVYLEGEKAAISARSLGNFNVQLVMESLGGGGHQAMAGAQLECSLEDAKAKLIEAIDTYIDINKNKK